jgi:selenide, water dikinase
MAAVPDDRVLVDYRTSDDAGVYRWDGETAIVQTVDFFTPIVDDPDIYGQVAAANALSDIYAMGGTPLTALAVAGFPRHGVDRSIIRSIFAGGLRKLQEAGVVLLGGHTVQDVEIKFGYAVTGTIRPDAILSNAGARPGDALVLTKPIGTGIIATAIKFQRAPADVVERAVASMLTLNRAAADALRSLGPGAVHACTDITGFGLIGHASELATASGCTLQIVAHRVPLLEGAKGLVRKNRTGGGETNAEYFGPRVGGAAGLDPEMLALLYDPQTSGGLLAAVEPARAEHAVAVLRETGATAAVIGEVVTRSDLAIRLM